MHNLQHYMMTIGPVCAVPSYCCYFNVYDIHTDEIVLPKNRTEHGIEAFQYLEIVGAHYNTSKLKLTVEKLIAYVMWKLITV